MDPFFIVVIIVIFAMAFDFTNGMNDAANAIATVITTRVLSPRVAVIFGAVLNFIGAFCFQEVAKTLSKGIFHPSLLTPSTLLATVIAAPIWILWCTLKGLPISCSHSLMGALIGAGAASAGISKIETAGIQKIVYGIFASPIAGFLLAVFLVVAITRLFHRVRPGTANNVFGKLQILSAGTMAFAHGTGDAQKAMGIVTMALMVTGYQSTSDSDVRLWVRILCATMMGLGTGIGGWAVIKTLGSRLAHIKTYQGFAAETASAASILFNTHLGIPISTTHSITGAIMGVGAARGMRQVRWGVGRKIVFAWVCTFPVCTLGAALVLKILRASGMT